MFYLRLSNHEYYYFVFVFVLSCSCKWSWFQETPAVNTQCETSLSSKTPGVCHTTSTPMEVASPVRSSPRKSKSPAFGSSVGSEIGVTASTCPSITVTGVSTPSAITADTATSEQSNTTTASRNTAPATSSDLGNTNDGTCSCFVA